MGLHPTHLLTIHARIHCSHPRPVPSPTPPQTRTSPHRYASRSFNAANAQTPIPDDESARLEDSGILRVQRIVGSILYYTRALDAPLLPALTEIGSNQAKATKETLAATKNFLTLSSLSQTPAFNISPVTCASGSIPTLRSHRFEMPAAASGVSSISRHTPPKSQKTAIHPSMDRSMSFAES